MVRGNAPNTLKFTHIASAKLRHTISLRIAMIMKNPAKRVERVIQANLAYPRLAPSPFSIKVSANNYQQAEAQQIDYKQK